MEELRQEFLNEAVFSLETLQKESQSRTETYFSDSFLHQLFRRIHTIKGTSQTFDFKISGTVAHEIENLLQALRDNKLIQDKAVSSIIEKSLQVLLNTLRNEQKQFENVYPQEFVEKIRTLIPNSKPETISQTFLNNIPAELLTSLSISEKDALLAAIQNGKNFYLIDVGFDFADFDERFKEFAGMLSKYGEIIAAAPGSNVDLSQQIGFQIFFVGKIESSEISESLKPFKAVLSFENLPAHENHSNNLQGILARIVETGEKTAQALGKKVDFQILSSEINPSPKNLKIIYEILLHLTRNAVDHAIESPEKRLSAFKNPNGEIKTAVSINKNEIILRVEDDGCGIDTKKVIEKAQQNGIIPAEVNLSEKEALELIFLYGFSTSETVSEISGRGVGLDVIKEIVDKANGEIKIQTIIGHGTIFEVYLPE